MAVMVSSEVRITADRLCELAACRRTFERWAALCQLALDLGGDRGLVRRWVEEATGDSIFAFDLPAGHPLPSLVTAVAVGDERGRRELEARVEAAILVGELLTEGPDSS